MSIDLEKKRAYHREYMRRRRAAARAAPVAGNDPRHGTLNGYTNLGCRCGYCKKAMRAYQRSQDGKADLTTIGMCMRCHLWIDVAGRLTPEQIEVHWPKVLAKHMLEDHDEG